MRHCARATVSVALGVLALCGFLPAFAVAAGKCGTVGNPGLSCADIFDAGGSVGDGVYSVRAPDGTVHSVYCDMQAGGYQLVAKIARGDSSVTDVEGAWNDGALWQRAACSDSTDIHRGTCVAQAPLTLASLTQHVSLQVTRRLATTSAGSGTVGMMATAVWKRSPCR